MTTSSHLGIEESEIGGWLRLKLSGEVDMASAPVLEQRLDQLRAQGVSVLMDLSELEFMDSRGLHLMIDQLQRRQDGWRLQIDPNLAPQVRRLFELVRLDLMIVGADSNGH